MKNISNKSEGFSLYKVKVDGSQRTSISADSAFYLNVVGENIYYLNADDNAMVINSDENWIYFTNASDNTYLYKIRFDGTGRTRLNSHSSIQLSIIGDWVYYKTRIDGSEDKLVE